MDSIEIWDHFEKCNDELHERKAKCRHCDQIYCYTSTVCNLKKHLERKHGVYVYKRPKTSPQSLGTSRRKRNKIWNTFTKTDLVEKLATCRLCDSELSYKTTSGNLTKHLKNKHSEAYDVLFSNGGETEDEEWIDEESDDDHASTTSKEDVDQLVSGYFERETGGRARCAVCRATAPHRPSAMRRHLRDHHPKLLPVEAQDEAEEEDSLFTEVIYLEDNPPKSEEKPSKRARTRSQYNERSSSSWRHISPAREENVTPKKKRRPSSPEPRKSQDIEEIESFGAYIICLLKSLPKDVCSAVQRDIITLIVNTKLTKPAEVVTETAVSNTQASGSQNYVVVNDNARVEESKIEYRVEIAPLDKDSNGTNVTNGDTV